MPLFSTNYWNKARITNLNTFERSATTFIYLVNYSKANFSPGELSPLTESHSRRPSWFSPQRMAQNRGSSGPTRLGCNGRSFERARASREATRTLGPHSHRWFISLSAGLPSPPSDEGKGQLGVGVPRREGVQPQNFRPFLPGWPLQGG